MARITRSSITTDFTNLLTAIEANAADFTSIEAERTEFRTLIPRINEMSAFHAAQKARSQQTTKDLNELIDRGLVLFAQLRSAVKAKYTTRSEKLTEFNLRPLNRRRSPAAPAAQAATPPKTP